jgi:riboflavin biosynthesis RibT protein
MMLIIYKDDYQKIAMGFLSYEEDLKDIHNLQTELKLYTSDPSHQLFMYRADTNNFCGVVGIELGDDYVLLRHLDLAPEYRQQAVINELLSELSKQVHGKKLMGSLETTPLIMKWAEQSKENCDGTNPSPE